MAILTTARTRALLQPAGSLTRRPGAFTGTAARRASAWIAGAMVAGGVWACAPEVTESNFPDQAPPGTSAVDDSRFDGDIGAGRGTGDMNGTWMLIHENSACLDFIRVEETLSHTYYLIEIEQEGRKVYERRRVCSVDLGPTVGLRAIVPRETLESVVFPELDHGVVSDARPGGSYSSPTEVLLWGVALSDPVNEPLPTTADDPRVVDLNNDGNPGVTFRVQGSSCERYVVQRTVSRYHGTFTTPNMIEGRSTTVTDTRTMDASDRICAIDIELIPNDPHSRFRMVRVDGRGGSINIDRDGDGEISCADLNAVRDLFWAPREPNNENCIRATR